MIRFDIHLGHAVIFDEILTEDGWLIWHDRTEGVFKIWENGQDFNVLTVGGTPESNYDAKCFTLEGCLNYVKRLT